MSKQQKTPNINVVNRKARFNYEFLQTYTAGIQLFGTEIKAIREGKVSLNEGFCYFSRGELWLKNIHIGPYKMGSFNNHEPMRIRKLLLNRKELDRLQDSVKEKGLTIIPYRIFLNERNLIKVEIALAKGKKLHDKRDSIKERESKRDIAATLKNARRY